MFFSSFDTLQGKAYYDMKGVFLYQDFAGAHAQYPQIWWSLNFNKYKKSAILPIFFSGGDGENWTPVQTHSHNLSTYLVCVYLLRVLGFSTNKQPSQRALKSVLQNPKPKLCKVARWFDALTAYRVWAIKTGRNLCCCQSANAAVVVSTKSNDIVRFFICVYFLTEGLGVHHHSPYALYYGQSAPVETGRPHTYIL